MKPFCARYRFFTFALMLVGMGLAGSVPSDGAAGSPTTVLVDRAVRPEPAGTLPEQTLDFRYQPARWQTAIGLPDDPFKSLVSSDGTLLYDYIHRTLESFGGRVRATLEGDQPEVLQGQALWNARLPIVRTVKRMGGLALEEDAWAATPRGHAVAQWADQRTDYLRLRVHNPGAVPADGRLAVVLELAHPVELAPSRTSLLFKDDPGKRAFCSFWPPCEALREGRSDPLHPAEDVAVSRGWARPAAGEASARFRDVIIGWNRPISFRYPCRPGHAYMVAFGFIEGYHDQGDVRPLEIWVEGQCYRTLDLAREFGRNLPAVCSYQVRDNGDGVLDLAVRSPQGARDPNTILTGLWIFAVGNAPDPDKILTGQADALALAYVDADRIERMNRVTLLFPALRFQPGGEYSELIAFHRGPKSPMEDLQKKNAGKELANAAQWWSKADLPYDRIRIPDPTAQALLDASIRNIYQAREIRDGKPAFQVGPTCYRGLWAVDGAFITEAVTYLGRGDEAERCLEMLLQEDDAGPGGVAFSKKAGIHLWTLLRHAELTGDWDWLLQNWPKVQAEVKRIQQYRAMSLSDDNADNDGLMPKGTGDGGLGGMHWEYTNVYWNLTGLSCAVQMAERLGQPEASDWRREYGDFWQAFDRARVRDATRDSYGNRYVPVVMRGERPQLPQCGAWSFMQSVFLDKVFAPTDALMLSTMQMLDATQEEGLVYGTGWIADGIWNYAGSFYAHAHLALGHGGKAAATLYAFGNHASPLLCWREEQNLVGARPDFCGDMPHNWASGEYIRLVRHLMILERGRDLHLLPGLPEAWTHPGMRTALEDIPTSFGPISLDFQVAADGRTATLRLKTPRRERPARIILHTQGLGGRVREVWLGKRFTADQPLPVKLGGTLLFTLTLNP